MPRPTVNDFPIKTLRNLLDYDPETGVLTWKERTWRDFPTPRRLETVREWNKKNSGKNAAKKVTDGYLVVATHNRQFRAHRVAWAIFHGEWPSDQIDHINGVRDDNRISNLREVNNKQNSRNQRRRKTNKSGVTGVFWSDAHGMWLAQIRVSGRCKHLGRFEDFDSAVKARKSAEKYYRFHSNHGSSPEVSPEAKL